MAPSQNAEPKPKAVVLLSGGMDSCVTTAIANLTHRLAVLYVSYGQRTERREQTGCRARRLRANLALIDHRDRHACFAQVVRDGAADDAAADNHDICCG